MTEHMTEHTTTRYNDGEVLSGGQRRRRWAPEEKVRIVEETYLPGMSVSLVGLGAAAILWAAALYRLTGAQRPITA